MVRSQLPEVLQAGINLRFDDEGKTVERTDEAFFGSEGPKAASIKRSTVTGMGLLRRKQEQGPTAMDEIQRGRALEIVAESFALGFNVSEEMEQDNEVGLMNKMAGFLGLAAEESVQFSAAMTIGKGFGAIVAGSTFPTNSSTTDVSSQTQTYVGPDGVSLFSTAHPIAGTPAVQIGVPNVPMPGSYSNCVSLALTEANLGTALRLLDTMPNERGLPSKKKAAILLVPPALRMTARQILKSDSTNTANISSGVRNLVADENLTLKVWEHLVDPDDWFLLTADSKNHLIKFARDLSSPLKHGYDNNKMVYTVTVLRRWGFGWDNPRCIVGSFA